jgi:hypothetical protein
MILYIKCQIKLWWYWKNNEFAAQYKEELIENEICFNAYIVEIGELEGYYGHFEYDAKKQNIKMSLGVSEIKWKANFI